jgi:signal transduction histidine kinase
VNAVSSASAERALILAPQGRDAAVARDILAEAGVKTTICPDVAALVTEIGRGSELAILTEEGLRNADTRPLAHWVASQPPWSDFPFIVLTRHGGGIERNPEVARLTATLGNVTLLERPFHPTTLVSVVETNLRGRRRQYECRRLNEELEARVQERTAELAAANRQLLAQMEERERMEMTLRQMQRLEAVGQLTSGVAHDFNNLLTVVLGNIGYIDQTLRNAGIDGAAARRLGYMKTAAQRGAKLTDQLLSFSRRQRLEPKILDLNETVAGMRDLLQSTIGGAINVEITLEPDLWPAFVDPTQIELAVLNLAINARDAMQIGGTLNVSTHKVTLGAPHTPEEPAAGEYVEICVADTGAGMPSEVRAKVFEPFFTTKEVGKGSGLGLSQVLGFAKQSDGGVSIESQLGKGTKVRIFLPRATGRASRPVSGRAAAAAVTTRPAKILIVDDDTAVRDVTATMLRENGHQVFEAGSGGAALELIAKTPDIELTILDLAMPGMSGVELAQRIKAKSPLLPVLFVTGFADRRSLGDMDDAQIVGKPFVTNELIEKVHQALSARATPA